MDDKNFNLAETEKAISGLSEALAHLNAELTAKKNQLKADDKQYEIQNNDREEKLELLQMTSRKMLGSLDGIITQLDKVLEDNGTSHHNN